MSKFDKKLYMIFLVENNQSMANIGNIPSITYQDI